MTIHNLKLLEQFADAVASGEKNFEIRINDRGFQKGDLVQFHVVALDPPHVAKEHPVNDMYFEITYVLTGFEISKDYCVFGIRRDRTDDALAGRIKVEIKPENINNGFRKIAECLSCKTGSGRCDRIDDEKGRCKNWTGMEGGRYEPGNL